jgi:hypothetical protein
VSNESSRAMTLAAIAFQTAACVSTDLDHERDLPVCARRESSGSAAEGVVQVILVEPPDEACNGVAIAPTLLLTAVNCVTALATEGHGAGFTAPRCKDTGAPVEDGSFIFRFSTVADPASILVRREDGTTFEPAVARVFVSSTSSSCMPDIAVLQMQFALDVPIVPVRLEETELTGEDVIVSGYEVTEDSLRRHESTATVVESTSDTGSATLPPRSLLLSGQTCAKPGGAVLAVDTGALVGLIQTTERTINCDAAMESPVAIRIEPFRQFLLETAEAAQASLVSELRPEGSGSIPACPEGS